MDGLGQAAITSIGDITPAYDGSQPWNVGGLLTIGVTGEAALTVSDGSGLIAGGTFVGSEAGGVRVGYMGKGTVAISNGGTATSTGP